MAELKIIGCCLAVLYFSIAGYGAWTERREAKAVALRIAEERQAVRRQMEAMFASWAHPLGHACYRDTRTLVEQVSAGVSGDGRGETP